MVTNKGFKKYINIVLTDYRPPERAQAAQKATVMKIEKSQSPLEFFLLSLTPQDIEYRLGPKLTRLLKKYRERRVKWENRAREVPCWTKINILNLKYVYINMSS